MAEARNRIGTRSSKATPTQKRVNRRAEPRANAAVERAKVTKKKNGRKVKSSSETMKD
jgi:hypothetical protein